MTTMVKERVIQVDTSELRQRKQATTSGSNAGSSCARLTEEILVDKLDLFLSKIESRLNNFDQFFKFKRDQLGIKSVSDQLKGPSSLDSIKTFLLKHLDVVHERLRELKSLVLRYSITNLDYLYLSIEDQYNYLFNTDLEKVSATNPDAKSVSRAEPTVTKLGKLHSHVGSPVEKPDVSQPDLTVDKLHDSHSHSEILMEKIIQSLHFFDQKLLQIDTFIIENKPAATADYSHLSVFKNLRYYNFNRALKAAKSRHLHYHELPLLWRENKYIVQGYRFLMSHRFLVNLVFTMHNETMNIWSHIAGLAIITYIARWHYPLTHVYSVSSVWDRSAIYLFLAAACECLLLLVSWHAYLGCAHYRTRCKCASVDYTGITMLITCSIISAEYMSLHNHPRLLAVYIVFSVLCGLVGMVFNWIPYFDRPECRYLRIGFFVGLAFLGATSTLCMIFYEGPRAAFGFFFPITYQSLVFYGVGVTFYGGLIPERWRYDVIIPDDEFPETAYANHYNALDVLYDEVEKSGMHEIKEIETELRTANHPHLNKIIKHHFPKHVRETPCAKDFMSLWWVDYCFSSHNIWHVCVVLGVIGHYFTLLQMADKMQNSSV